MARAGELDTKIAFDKREQVNPDSPDDLGNVESDFVEQFVRRAKVRAKFGGEAVVAARLQGQQPVTITVRQDSQTALIRTDWRARNAVSGEKYAIRSIVDPDGDGSWFEVLTQTGASA